MPMNLHKRHCLVTLCVLSAMFLSLGFGAMPVLAQDEDPALEGGPVQQVEGFAEPGGGAFYMIPDLKQGQTLYAYAAGTTGNLDPFLGLSDVRLDGAALSESFWGRVAEVYYAMLGKQPRYTSKSLKILSLGVTVCGDLAKKELGHHPRPILDSFADTVAWLHDSGFIE